MSSRSGATSPFYLYGINKLGMTSMYGEHTKWGKKEEKIVL
jgi:hypothetical protein